MTVALFVTCLTDTFFPRVGEAVVRVLRHFGCRVEFPAGQTCCGQPALNSGFHAEAATLARRMITIFEPYEHVVTPSASCAAMVKHHFVELLADNGGWRERAERLAHKTHEFSVFLRDVLSVDIARHVRITEPFTYHYACHAREIVPHAELVGWLRSVAASEPASANSASLREAQRPDVCCGFGGAFAVELPEVSGAMLREKLDDLAATGARVVVCNEGGCTLQLCGGAHRRGLPLRFVHLAECMAESMGLMEPIA